MQITKTKLILGAAGLTAVVALATAGTLAVFTTTQTSSANTFSTGKIDLTIGAGAIVTFSGGGMMPGDAVSGSVTVTNAAPTGTENELRYAVTATASGNPDLITELYLIVKKTANGLCGAANAARWTYQSDETWLYSGNFAGAGLVSGSTRRLVGSVGQGQYSAGTSTSEGDPLRNDRILTATDAGTTDTENLCFQVSLPIGTTSGVSNTRQGATATNAFNFVAEQTINNTGAESIADYSLPA